MPQLPSVSELIVGSQEQGFLEPATQVQTSPTSPRIHNSQHLHYKRFDRASLDGAIVDTSKPINSQLGSDYFNYNIQPNQNRPSVSSSLDPLSRNSSLTNNVPFKPSPLITYQSQQHIMMPNSSYFPSSVMQQHPVMPIGNNGMIPVGSSPLIYTPSEPFRLPFYQPQNKHHLLPNVPAMKDSPMVSPQVNFQPVYHEMPYFYQQPVQNMPYSDPENVLQKHRIVKKRTRTGCLTCRKRRIKCDEKKPQCFNCERSKKVCLGYEDVSSLKSKKKRPTEKEKEVPKLPKLPQLPQLPKLVETIKSLAPSAINETADLDKNSTVENSDKD